MAGRIVLPPTDPALDANGDPISGSLRYFYENGTTTLKTIYSSAAGAALANPTTADAAGRFPDTFGDGSYSVKWTDAAGATILTFDDVLPTLNPPFVGVKDAGNAPAGYIGQFVEAYTPTSPGVAVPNDQNINICSVLLTPGDWDVEAMGGFVFGGSGATRAQFGISTTSSNMPSDNGGGLIDISATFSANVSGRFPTGRRRVSISDNTDVFLVAYNVTAGSSVGFGYLSARRMR